MIIIRTTAVLFFIYLIISLLVYFPTKFHASKTLTEVRNYYIYMNASKKKLTYFVKQTKCHVSATKEVKLWLGGREKMKIRENSIAKV